MASLVSQAQHESCNALGTFSADRQVLRIDVIVFLLFVGVHATRRDKNYFSPLFALTICTSQPRTALFYYRRADAYGQG